MAKTKAKNKDTKKKNIKEIEIEEVEEIEEFDDEEFDFVDEEEDEVVVTKKTALEDDTEDDELEPLTIEERIISVEKKLNIALVFIIIAALFSLMAFVANLSGGVTTYSDEHVDAETDASAESASYDTSAFTKVKAQELEKLSKGKKIIVWIGRQGCGYCSNYVSTITQIGEDFGETIYYLDLADIFDFSGEQVTLLDEKAYDIMMNFATDKENEKIMDEFGATPMTLIIKNNKIVGSFTGALDAETITSTLKAEGFKLAK